MAARKSSGHPDDSGWLPPALVARTPVPEYTLLCQALRPRNQLNLKPLGAVAFLAFAFAVCVPGTSVGVLHTGIGFGAWDFSDSTTSATTYDFIPTDTFASETVTRPLDVFLMANFPAMLAVLPSGTVYQDVAEAPADPFVYYQLIIFIQGRVWIVKTREGNYAKFRYLEPGVPTQFEYTYQDDGSRRLAQPLAVQISTWGRIKALYR